MKIGTKSYASVKVENNTDVIIVPISTEKPDIPVTIQSKWQRIADLTAQIMNVPSGQITRFTEENLVIFAASPSARNPFKNGDAVPLGTGMFCETVVGKREPMTVSDIRPSSYWKDNPLVETGMISYIGVPIKWEDGEVFGTFCLLDNKANEFSSLFRQLMLEFKNVIESDLQSILLQHDLQKKLSAQEMLLREAHHRINNHFSLLISYVQLCASEREDNRDVHNILLDIQNRIRSISIIHEELCRSTHEQLPPLNRYITRLCDHIIANVAKIPIETVYAIEPLDLPVERAVSIGLIVSELLTNSIKYAFEANASPRIDIRIARNGAKRISIGYRDNGKGLPLDFDIDRVQSMGMTIIRMQVKQFNGKITIDSVGGAGFAIEIDG
jgi:two-component sensor histidine kinase